MASISENGRTALSLRNRSKRGDYEPPLSTDLRGPCPIINALANHGYISRDGHNISSTDIKSAMAELGISNTIRTFLTYGAYLEYQPTRPTGFWAFIRNPVTYLLGHFGLRNPGQRNPSGVKCLNLDQLSRHGPVEHDASLSRRDFAQGDNHTSQKDLVQALLAASSNGMEFTTEDFVKLRQKRLTQQKLDNQELKFGAPENRVACGEIALIQGVFGDGSRQYSVPAPYMKALFEEERLPVEEGWRRRKWWPLGVVETVLRAKAIISGVGKID